MNTVSRSIIKSWLTDSTERCQYRLSCKYISGDLLKHSLSANYWGTCYFPSDANGP